MGVGELRIEGYGGPCGSFRLIELAATEMHDSLFSVVERFLRLHLHGTLNIIDGLLEHTAAHLSLHTTIVEVCRQRVGFQVLIVVKVANGVAIASDALERVGSHEQGRGCGFNIGTCVAGDGTILEGQYGSGICEHLLALRRVEVVLGSAEVRLVESQELLTGFGIALEAIEQLCLQGGVER